ncbi:MAG: hypothetical protein H6625_06025 [Bdellovibrionaceae bacterium]|nr:hypothetical protein [Pseudobdellovibrionaceae bacterium]
MIYIFVGHRGTGKSHFLKDLKKTLRKYDQNGVFADLDTEIEKEVHKSISEIFESEGEASFRKHEEKTLFKLLNEKLKKNQFIVVALGAGYSAKLPESATIIWLQRSTDSMGRIFLDRPRLDTSTAPLEEYLQRYKKRSMNYQDLADETLFLPENYQSTEPWLPLFWGLTTGDIGGCLTLLPRFLEDKKKTQRFLQKRLNWGVRYFEMRTDLLSIEQLHWVREIVPESQLLLSIREKPEIPFELPELDWALELGEPPGVENILSLHERSTSLPETFKRFNPYKSKHLKLAIEINTWEELHQAYEWQKEDPENRSFLPRSKTGRWSWYRLLNKYRMKLNFFQEDIGNTLDQPSFADWCNFSDYKDNQFGAILGSPVTHSWTPEEQRSFWSSKQCNALSIEIKEEEWSEDVINFLRELGLVYAAVTSPLKAKAFQVCNKKDLLANELEMANTLKFEKENCYGFNTDFYGFKVLCETQVLPILNKPLAEWKVAIWGGGGTLPVLKKLFPRAEHFSARSGQLSQHNPLLNKIKASRKSEYDVLVWAVGQSHIQKGAKFPNEKIKYKLILDLNYAENSPGRELAMKLGIKYISGASMFKAQAERQRQLWT